MPTAVPCQTPVSIVPTLVSDEVTTVALSVVPESVPAGAALKKARDPSVPPVPMFSVELSVPASVSVLLTVRVFDVVPPATVNPVAAAASVKPLTLVGVITPSVRLIAGVVVALATVPETPLAVVTETLVTVPPPAAAQVPSPRQKVEAVAPLPELRRVTGKFPVTPVVSGNPVALVSVRDVGVPPAPLNKTIEPFTPVAIWIALNTPVP